MTQNIHPSAVKGMISYYYLVAFCPPAHISALKKASQKTGAALAKLAGLKMADFVKAVAPEVAYRICAFQEATREPDKETVEKLAKPSSKPIPSQKRRQIPGSDARSCRPPGAGQKEQPPAPPERL